MAQLRIWEGFSLLERAAHVPPRARQLPGRCRCHPWRYGGWRWRMWFRDVAQMRDQGKSGRGRACGRREQEYALHVSVAQAKHSFYGQGYLPNILCRRCRCCRCLKHRGVSTWSYELQYCTLLSIVYNTLTVDSSPHPFKHTPKILHTIWKFTVIDLCLILKMFEWITWARSHAVMVWKQENN